VQLIWHAIHLICYFAQPEFPKLGSLTELRQERCNNWLRLALHGYKRTTSEETTECQSF